MTGEGLAAADADPPDRVLVITLTDVEGVGANVGPLASSEGMATVNGHRPDREATRALLEEIAGGRRGEQLRATVAGWNRGATREQIEEAFQEACARAARGCTGQTMGEVYVWLRTTTHRELGDMRNRVQHEIPVDVSNAAIESSDGSLASPVEVLIEREDHAEVNRLTLAVLDRLAERESHGLARSEIAQHLGVSPRIVKRSVEAILATARDQLVRLVGFGCPDGHELVARYAFGLTARRDARRARLHLMSCPRCAAMHEELGNWRERVAALLPAPPVVEAHADVVERVAQAGTEALSSGRPPAPGGVRKHLADAVAHVREQAAAVYYRTVDPTPLAGVRPGGAAAVVASCLAVGGGATYCVTNSVDPIAGLARAVAPAGQQDKQRPREARNVRQQATPTPTPTVAATPTTHATRSSRRLWLPVSRWPKSPHTADTR
jgi:DNA-directed RNA polymerase specialized sigma24 family protein